MDVNVRKKEKFKILDIEGDVNELDNYNVLEGIVVDSIENGEKFIALNLSNTTFLNSGAVSLFISWQKKLETVGGEIVILEPSQVILEILNILCIEKIIRIYMTEDEFIDSIGG